SHGNCREKWFAAARRLASHRVLPGRGVRVPKRPEIGSQNLGRLAAWAQLGGGSPGPNTPGSKRRDETFRRRNRCHASSRGRPLKRPREIAMKAIIDAANSNRWAQSPAGMVKRDAERKGARDKREGMGCDPG